LAAEVENECGFSLKHLQVSVHPKQELRHHCQDGLLIQALFLLLVGLCVAFCICQIWLSPWSFWCSWIWRQLQAVIQQRCQVLEGLQHLCGRILVVHLPVGLLHSGHVRAGSRAAKRLGTVHAGALEPVSVL
jgi:hypothetical protein